MNTTHTIIIHRDNFRTCNIFLFSAMVDPSIQGFHWFDATKFEASCTAIHPSYYKDTSV